MAVRIEAGAEPIPGYRLIERIGGGGFGVVWKAEAPGGLMKAIKFVYGDMEAADEEEGVRAEQEKKAMDRIKNVRHHYLLSLDRIEEIDGTLTIVMELADRNLWDRFRECRSQGLIGIPRVELLGYMAEAAEALDFIDKECKLQHLDIKPQNLFLVRNHIKVADFGLVKDLIGTRVSVTGGVTPVYAAPETFDGQVTHFCDQYSLAIVYQELLTGHRPFQSTNIRQLVLAHMQGTPDLSHLPPFDRDIIGKALAKVPEKRHPTCQMMIKALQEAEAKDKKPEPASDTALIDTPSALTAADQTAPDSNPPSSNPSGGPVTRWIRTHEEAPKQTPVQRVAIPDVESDSAKMTTETVGDGHLFPSLIIGLGSIGLGILKRVATTLAERFGSHETLPNIRMLYIDTDPDSMRLASSGEDGAGLRRSEVLLAPLHRPPYYLKPKEGRARIDTWLDPKMLYRIPRHAFSAGVRALGRLAFVDNYKAITLRLRADLEACSDPGTLETAARETGLGIRTTKPRVYVATSLAGGTGSGMFLDLAYVTRTLLRQLGHENPEVVGLFLLPSAQRGASQAELGNAYAALTELNHFSSQGTTFSASYDTQDARVTGPIVDACAPFTRCFLLPTLRPASGGSQYGDKARLLTASAAESLALGSHFLVCDLTTPLGRCADKARKHQLDGIARNPGVPQETAPAELYCQTFGMHRLVWPRRALLIQAARRLCQRLVERWMSKDGKPIRDKVRDWVEDQLAKQELGADVLISQLQQACVGAMKKAPERAFAQTYEEITRLAAPGVQEELTAEVVGEALDQLEQMLGRPQPNNTIVRQDKSGPPSQLETLLRDAGEALLANFSQKMDQLAVYLIEEPAYRLAGAEEAIRQITANIEQTLQAQEQIGNELAERAFGSYGAIQNLHKALKSGKAVRGPDKRAAKGGWFGGNSAAEDEPNALAAQLNELLKVYCKSRYHSLILQRVIAIFVSLRGQLSDQMREVGFCRNRLTELNRAFGAPPPRWAGDVGQAETSSADPVIVQCLYPPGCKTLEDAIAKLLETVSDDNLNDLDQRIEVLIRREFTALVHVCLTAANMLRNLELAMQKETVAVLEGRLVGTKIGEMYLALGNAVEDPQAALEEMIANGFDEATPDVSGLITGSRPARSSEICILSALTEPSGDSTTPNFKDAAEGAFPGQQVLLTDPGSGTAGNEILYFREEACLALSDLKLLGPLGREAYRQLNSVEHYTPHARIDITEWQMAGGQAAASRE